jgi:leader peptidase (prepilin peptidase) / N-methyltransferase
MISGSSSAAETPAPSAPVSPRAAARMLDPVALGVGLAAAAAALAVLGTGSRGFVAACFLGTLGVLAVIDLRTHLLPNWIVLPSAALVLTLQLALFPGDAVEWVVASFGCFTVLLALALVRPGGIGMGDAKLGLLLGAGLGTDVAMAMLVGCLALWPVAVYILARHGLDARSKALPLGPALALGAALVTLAG